MFCCSCVDLLLGCAQGDDLHDYLRRSGKRFLLCAGLVTSVCVLLTAASAVQRHYMVAMLEDCCADYADTHSIIFRRYTPWALETVPLERVCWTAALCITRPLAKLGVRRWWTATASGGSSCAGSTCWASSPADCPPQRSGATSTVRGRLS